MSWGREGWEDEKLVGDGTEIFIVGFRGNI